MRTISAARMFAMEIEESFPAARLRGIDIQAKRDIASLPQPPPPPPSQAKKCAFWKDITLCGWLAERRSLAEQYRNGSWDIDKIGITMMGILYWRCA